MRLLVAAIFVASVLGCSHPTAPWHQDPLLQTSQLEYNLLPEMGGWSAQLEYQFTNETGGTVFIPNCRGSFSLRLERLENREWQSAWEPVLTLCNSSSIEIPPNDSKAFVLRLWGAAPGQNVAPRFSRSDPAGVYRIVWIDARSSLKAESALGEPIPLKYRLSNKFNLVH